MWKKVVVVKRPKLRRPVMLISLSTTLPQYRTLYSQARELANYIIRKLKFELMATLYSSALPPAVVIRQDGNARLISNHLYYYRGKRDIVLLAGDGSPSDEQYEFADEVLGFARSIGVREMYSVGARWSESLMPPLETPRVFGFASDSTGVAQLRANGVEIVKDEPAPFFANLVVGLAGLAGMRGYKISVNHGEPSPHPKSVIQLLGALTRMLHFGIDFSELESLASHLPNVIEQAASESEKTTEGQGIYH